MKPLSGVLVELVATSKQRVEAALPYHEQLEEVARKRPPAPDFRAALKSSEGLRLICEVKRASPSQGDIRPKADPVKVARFYAQAGTAAVSVLTEPSRFGGGIDDLIFVQQALPALPVLRKDFIVHEVQLAEARSAQASSALLMAAVLEQDELARLLAYARDLGLEPLVEVRGEAELEEALTVGARVIGINNRNLTTLEVDLAATFELAGQVPPEAVLVSESGIHGPEQARELRATGVDALLVGTSLMRAEKPEELIRELLQAGAGPRPRRAGRRH